MLKKFIFMFMLVNGTLVYSEDVKMGKTLEIDIAWGGYYASISDNGDEISVFRLLGFNRDAYHIAMYKEKFEAIPTVEYIKSLTPFIWHAPIDSKALLNEKRVTLLGSVPLKRSDLEGYIYYLKEFEVSDKEVDELVLSLISFSKQGPLSLNLYIENGELHIQEKISALAVSTVGAKK